jgi:pyrophosphate--fructose-6-phosphate 1-phosphotransferase
MTPLKEARLKEVPPLPEVLKQFTHVETGIPSVLNPEIAMLFPHLIKAQPSGSIEKRALRVGVVLSGGQAAGGHNVICALQKGLLRLNEKSELIGFLNGPSGIIDNQFKVLTSNYVDRYLNTGGFDMIGSGRTKIETQAQFQQVLETVRKQKLDALVIIGGDDSNTNAALLAEYFLANNQPTAVIGVPKTIDGDLKNEAIEVSFGFDTATKTYSELVGNLLADALSAKKYWFFVRLMGRSASHITLEVAQNTHPNLTLISEEKRDLKAIVKEIADLIRERARSGKNYGMVLVPEGLIEFLPEVPQAFLSGMPVSYDSHGNLEVSKLETEKLFIELVKKELNDEVPFSPQALFFGYEGRSAYPSFFDATYTYALGMTAALLAAKGATGQMATVNSLRSPVAEWKIFGVPLVNMMAMEMRKNSLKPVIKKALVDLNSPHYHRFKLASEGWRLNDDYLSPGPIQFWGPKDIVESVPYIL